MQININSDNSVEKGEPLNRHVRTVTEAALKHFTGQVTRVEVHLSDRNAHKSDDGETRCLMEARLSRHEPIAVSEHAASLHQAINGAAEKLKRAIENTIGRLQNSTKGKQPVFAEPEPIDE
jgi:ribosome-associated translation inhibitor RaiA